MQKLKNGAFAQPQEHHKHDNLSIASTQESENLNIFEMNMYRQQMKQIQEFRNKHKQTNQDMGAMALEQTTDNMTGPQVGRHMNAMDLSKLSNVSKQQFNAYMKNEMRKQIAGVFRAQANKPSFIQKAQLAQVKLNGRRVAQTDNRTSRVDVRRVAVVNSEAIRRSNLIAQAAQNNGSMMSGTKTPRLIDIQ
jgi:hypothetical protein